MVSAIIKNIYVSMDNYLFCAVARYLSGSTLEDNNTQWLQWYYKFTNILVISELSINNSRACKYNLAYEMVLHLGSKN